MILIFYSEIMNTLGLGNINLNTVNSTLRSYLMTLNNSKLTTISVANSIWFDASMCFILFYFSWFILIFFKFFPPSDQMCIILTIFIITGFIPIKESYKQSMQYNYNADVYPVIDQNQIDQWVRAKTNGKIDSVQIPQNKEYLGAVLINAVSFLSQIFSKYVYIKTIFIK